MIAALQKMITRLFPRFEKESSVEKKDEKIFFAGCTGFF